MFHLSEKLYLNDEFLKYRLTMVGGRLFIDRYLQKYSSQESNEQYAIRKAMTYCPAFAKLEVNKILDLIAAEFPWISRTPVYEGPITLDGKSVNQLMAEILFEICVISYVGVYVDKAPGDPLTLQDDNDNKPYAYYYRAEQISAVDSWSDPKDVFLQDYYGKGSTRSKHVYQNEQGIFVQYDGEEPIKLNIKEFPFKIFALKESLLADIADYQINLLNQESVDSFYAYKLAFPIYTEQRDSLASDPAKETKELSQIQVGPFNGRAYARQLERPGFITPDPQNGEYKLKYQEKLRKDIATLLRCAIESLASASADSKRYDNSPYEAGLQAIAQKLQDVESWIHILIAEYQTGKPTKVVYPKNYTPKTDKERLSVAGDTLKLVDSFPGTKAKKNVIKSAYKALMAGRLPEAELQAALDEITAADYISADSTILQRDAEAGLVTKETASLARGYPAGEAAAAEKANLERVRAIAEAQAEVKAATAQANDPQNPTPGQNNIKDFSTTPAKDAKDVRQQQGGGRSGTGKPGDQTR